MDLTTVNIAKFVTFLAILAGLTAFGAADLRILAEKLAQAPTAVGHATPSCVTRTDVMFNDCADLDASANQVQDLR